MSTKASSVGLRARCAAVIAGLALALCLPSVALAANTASFSSALPKSGSISMVTTPMVRLTVYDKYGVKGAANYTMTIDGTKVTPTLTYIVVGAFNPLKPDYRRFALTYKVPSALSAGWHTVAVRVHDRKGKNSTYSWKIGIDSSAAAATFSGLTPAIASNSQNGTPRLAVTVADRWDVKGAGSYSLKLDGNAVPASIKYATAGNYRNFTVAYQVVTTLTPGPHVVAASVHDAAGRTTNASWSFTVLQPDPVYALMPAGGTCLDCHVGFPAAHPMSDCVACHGANSPSRPPTSLYAGTAMSPYTSADRSAHTLSCSTAAVCHGGGGPFPHVLDSNCARCHSPLHPEIRQIHTLDASALSVSHESTATFCTQTFCHAVSLTAEHYRWTDTTGAKLSCVTCHSNTNPQVVATISRNSAACADCHGTNAFRHPNTATAHAVVGDALTTCMGAGCHETDLSATHTGQCDFCHGANASQVVRNAVAAGDTRCATCHGIIGHTALHDLPNRSDACLGSGCHAGTNLTSIQVGGVTSSKHATCATCHGASAPQAAKTAIAEHNKSCSACHGAGLPSSHSGHATTVTADVMSINGVAYGTHACSECHTSDLQTIPQHPTCTTCHPTPASLVLKGDFTCGQARCHGGGTLSGAALVQHANISSSHDTTAGVTTRCGGVGCHIVTDVAAIHNALGRADHGCGICHDGKTVAAPTKNCSAAAGCHPTYPVKPTTHTSHISTVTAAVMTINGRGYGSISCATCHGNASSKTAIDLQRISQHSSCASCHPAAAAGAAKGNFTCNQNTCHGSGPRLGTALAQHAAISTAHDTTSGVTANCGGAGCHNDVSDVAIIHDALGRADRGCGICHDGTIVSAPTKNCAAAAGCHPTYPVKLPSHTSHISTVTADVITINGHAYGSITCATCHGNSGVGNADIDLQKISQHTNCASCHPSPAGSAGKNDFTCNQAACHGTGTLRGTALVQHANLDAAHNTTSGVTANCGGAGCHTDVSDVAIIHSTVPNRTDNGCGICHDGTIVSTPTKNCSSAAGCHPTYPVKPATHINHPSPVVADTLTIQGITYGPFPCAQCHGNTGTNNTVVDLQLIPQHPLCTTCHPTPASLVMKGNFTCNQIGCHGATGTHAGTARAQHYRISGIHNVTAAATNCGGSGCHTGGADVAAIHAALGRADSGCGICHGTTIVSAPTTDCASAAGCHPAYPGKPASHTSHVSTVTAGVLSINGIAYGSHSCTECHGNSGAGNSAIDLQKISQHTNCASCHPTAAGLAQTGNFTCNQLNCHGTGALSGTAIAQHVNISSAHDTSASATANCISSSCHNHGTDVGAIHNQVPGRTDHGCGICHDGSIVASPTKNCVAVAGCHLNGPPATHGAAAHLATVTTGTITLTGITTAVYTCSTCHTTLNLQNIHGGPDGCSKCHPDPANSIGHNNWNGSCNQGGCHTTTTSTMKTMHSTVDASHTLDTSSCAGPGGPCHSMNVAVIHNTPTTAHPAPKGCTTCHGRTTAPFALTKNCLTTGCHSGGTGGGGSFPPGHPAPAALHTSTTTDCISCHGATVNTIHTTCARCHDVGKPTPTTVCTTCHLTGNYHTNINAWHYSPGGSCHGQTGDLRDWHSSRPCSICHYPGANLWPNMTCGDCHSDDHC